MRRRRAGASTSSRSPTGTARWSVSITKLPSREKIASSLNFAGGHVIATTGGYIGDAPPYQGHVAVISPAGALLHVWNSLCSDRHGLLVPSSCGASDSAIWGRAGAVVDPANGQLLVATGNAPWDGRTNWGDAVLRLSADGSHLLGNYTPSNTEELNAGDVDLGSTSPVVLSPGIVAQGGKDGKIRLAERRPDAGHAPRIGAASSRSSPRRRGRISSPRPRSGIARTRRGSSPPTTAARRRGGSGTAGSRQAWRNGSGGTSPVVAGGLLWVYNPGGGLAVYVPGTGRRVATLAAGSGHWSSPIVVDGRVALPEGNANDHATSGVLDIWRLR